MTAAVVQGLEVIDVEHNETHRLAYALSARELAVEPGLEVGAVGQAVSPSVTAALDLGQQPGVTERHRPAR